MKISEYMYLQDRATEYPTFVTMVPIGWDATRVKQEVRGYALIEMYMHRNLDKRTRLTLSHLWYEQENQNGGWMD